MTSPASTLHSRFFPTDTSEINEDSTILRTLCCTPYLGTIAAFCIEASLTKQWSLTKSEPRMVEILHIKNQYKVAGIIRNFLGVALLVAATAYKIISFTPLNAACMTLLLLAVALNIHKRSENMKLIEEIETTGYKADMRAF